MILRSRLALLSLLALPCAAPLSAKEKVYVGENFFLWDVYGYPDTTWQGVYYNCFDAVAIAQVGEYVFSINGAGLYSHAHLRTDSVQVLLSVPGQNPDGVDIAAHAGDALIASSNGAIVRIDAATQAHEGTLQVGHAVSALATSGNLLIAGSPDGSLRLGHAMSGGFELKAALGAPISALLPIGGTLFVGTSDGRVTPYDLSTGTLGSSFGVANDVQTLARYQGMLLVGGSDGSIRRHDPATGVLIDTLQRDFPVRALGNFDDASWIDLHAVQKNFLLATGLEYDLLAETGPELVGDYYLVLGSFVPAWHPSLQVYLDGVGIPLIPDAYTQFTLSGAVHGVIDDARGSVPQSGSIAAKFHLPPGFGPSFIAAHAVVTVDLAAGAVSGASPARYVWGN
jgi:hypothetical protein